MAKRRYAYEVAVDIKSAREAAREMRQIFQRELGTITVGGVAGGVGGAGARRAIPGMIGDLRALKAAMVTTVGALGVIEIGRQALALGELGAQLNNTSLAFEHFSGSALEAQLRLDAIHKAARGTLDRLQAMRVANRLAALGLANSANEMGRVVALARQMSIAMGTDLTSALEDLSLAASNLSFQRLDQLGISADEVRKRFEDLRQELGDQRGFLEAVLQVGEENFGNLGEDAGQAADGIQRLRVQIRELRNDLAQQYGPAVDEVAGKTADAIEAWREGAKADKLLEEAIRDTRPEVQALARQIYILRDALDAGAISQEQYNERVGELTKQLAEAMEQAKETKDAVDALAEFRLPARPIITGPEIMSRRPLPGRAGVIRARLRGAALSGGFSGIPGAEYEDLASAEAALEEFKKGQQEIKEKQKRDAEEVKRAWERAAKEAARAFERSLERVPGLFGTSKVTDLDLELAKYGAYREKADEYLRQLRDEVLHGVDYAGVDIRDAARRAGIDPNLPAEIILKLFEESWRSGALFARPENLSLINWDAVRSELQRQAMSEQGKKNIIEFAKKQGINLGVVFGDGMAKGQALKALGPGTSSVGEELATSFAKGFQDHLGKTDFAGSLRDVLLEQAESKARQIEQAGKAFGARFVAGMADEVTVIVLPALLKALAQAVAENP